MDDGGKQKFVTGSGPTKQSRKKYGLYLAQTKTGAPWRRTGCGDFGFGGASLSALAVFRTARDAVNRGRVQGQGNHRAFSGYHFSPSRRHRRRGGVSLANKIARPGPADRGKKTHRSGELLGFCGEARVY